MISRLVIGVLEGTILDRSGMVMKLSTKVHLALPWRYATIPTWTWTAEYNGRSACRFSTPKICHASPSTSTPMQDDSNVLPDKPSIAHAIGQRRRCHCTIGLGRR